MRSRDPIRSTRHATPRRCRVCGCDQERGCPKGCYWVGPDLCSSCVQNVNHDGIAPEDDYFVVLNAIAAETGYDLAIALTCFSVMLRVKEVHLEPRDDYPSGLRVVPSPTLQQIVREEETHAHR